MDKHLLLKILLFFPLVLCACGKDDAEDIIPPTGNSRSDMKYIKTSVMTVGIDASLKESDNAVVKLVKQLNNLPALIPGKGLSLVKKDTIWFLENKKENRYIPTKETNSFAGSIVIGSKSTYASADTLLLWNWLAELTYDRHISADRAEELNTIYKKVTNAQYKEVYRYNGTKIQKDKVSSPAIKSVQSYLGELLKSCYTLNTYYPFVHEELARFDSEGKAFVESIFGEKQVTPNPNGITLPPIGYTQWIEIKNGTASTTEVPLDLWYSKYILAKAPQSGLDIPIVASRFVSDSAIVQCKLIVETMIKKLPKYALQWMHNSHYRIGIIGAQEQVTDLPENRAMPLWWSGTDWDTRGRGYGATLSIPLMSCGEENIVYLPSSPFASWYATESIMVHEFAHNVDQGLRESDGSSGNPFEKELLAAYDNAQATGLWKGTYSMENSAEYWAEGVQAWFNTCRMIVPAKGDGKEFMLKYRTQFAEYDPLLYRLIAKYLPEEQLKGYHFDYEP